MDLRKGERGSCSNTFVTSTLNGNQVTGIEAGRVSSVTEEEDQEPRTFSEIKTEPKMIHTIKVETDVSIDNEEDVIGMETDEVCVPQECESDEKVNTVTVEGVKHVGEEDCIKIKTEKDYVQSVWTVKGEQENSMDLGETVPSVYCETCLTVSADGSEGSYMRAEEVLHTQTEEDHLAVALPAVKVADLNCMGFVEGDTGSCSDTRITCDIDRTEEVSIKVEVPIDIKDEIPEDATFLPIKTDHEGTPNEQLHLDSAECRYASDIYRGARPYVCDVCNKAFTKKSNLIRHQRIHSGERPYVCDVCKKAFITNSKLITHQRIHSGERPYTCEVCNKAFIQQSNLIRHQRMHSGERPYGCEVCKKAFSENKSLVTHQRVHSGVRPYSCEICSKAFSVKSNLIKHQRMHSGERPFTCDVCNKAFRKKRSLITHLHIHSGDGVYN